jgi:hypothetical protein
MIFFSSVADLRSRATMDWGVCLCEEGGKGMYTNTWGWDPRSQKPIQVKLHHRKVIECRFCASAMLSLPLNEMQNNLHNWREKFARSWIHEQEREQLKMNVASRKNRMGRPSRAEPPRTI